MNNLAGVSRSSLKGSCPLFFEPLGARLKSCPDTKPVFETRSRNRAISSFEPAIFRTSAIERVSRSTATLNGNVASLRLFWRLVASSNGQTAGQTIGAPSPAVQFFPPPRRRACCSACIPNLAPSCSLEHESSSQSGFRDQNGSAAEWDNHAIGQVLGKASSAPFPARTMRTTNRRNRRIHLPWSCASHARHRYLQNMNRRCRKGREGTVTVLN